MRPTILLLQATLVHMESWQVPRGKCRLCIRVSLPTLLQVVEAAHQAGIRTSSTVMFGHMDGFGAWARHLLALRALQARTGGITEFVPLPFVHMQAPLYLKGGSVCA
jgi:FO synthase